MCENFNTRELVELRSLVFMKILEIEDDLKRLGFETVNTEQYDIYVKQLDFYNSLKNKLF